LPAAHAQSAGEDAIRREAACDAALHDLPDTEDVAEDVAPHGFGCVGCVAATRALIAHHDLIDAQVVAFRHIQQLGSAAEG